jgi:hypothetical protein
MQKEGWLYLKCVNTTTIPIFSLLTRKRKGVKTAIKIMMHREVETHHSHTADSLRAGAPGSHSRALTSGSRASPMV